MMVDIMSYTPVALRVLARACHCCTSKDIALFDDKDGIEDMERLVRRVIDSGHTSILEHVSFTFLVKDVSRALTHQLVRHRIASYAQQSQRYVDGSDFKYTIPDSILAHQDTQDMFESCIQNIRWTYNRLKELGVPLEDCRYLLPNACNSNIVVTMNCRSLLNFFEQRLCKRAQWEIRKMAETMLRHCQDVLPVVFADAGPKCKRLGYCPEAKGCGMVPKRKDKQ